MVNNEKLLIIDDEPAIRQFLRLSLETQGYQIVEARTGEHGLELVASEQPALIILDMGLPDMDGQQVLTHIREWSMTPIIVLSVRAEEAEKVMALDNGANDYVTKPFGINELVARIRALRRTNDDSQDRDSLFKAEQLCVDRVSRRAWIGSEEIKLTRKEYALLNLFINHAGKVLTHQQILNRIWGSAQESETHYLRVLIGQLRKKLGDSPVRPKYIITETGIGYRFMASS